ncbi:MAG: hypothetical protein ACK5LO_10720 [Leucobacter sp.]
MLRKTNGGDLVSDAPARGIDRRKLLKGAAWSVPVMAVAVSAPLAAATGGVTGSPLKFNNVTINSGNQGTGNIIGNFGVQYVYAGWGPNYGNWGQPGVPGSITVTWTVDILNSSNQVVASQSSPSGTAVARSNSIGPIPINFSGIPAGNYQVRVTVLGQPNPAIVDGNAFVVNPLVDTKPATVL